MFLCPLGRAVDEHVSLQFGRLLKGFYALWVGLLMSTLCLSAGQSPSSCFYALWVGLLMSTLPL
jgi:hypothetical protein